MESEEIFVNSFDYLDDTVLRFRLPTTTTIKPSKTLPTMSPINHGPHGQLLADYRQWKVMKDWPLYSYHHPHFGNKSYSVFTHFKHTNITFPEKPYKFKADEEETLEQAKDKRGKSYFYVGPGGYITEEPIIPYVVMKKMCGKHSNWDYYRAHKELQNNRKKRIKQISTIDVPMYRIIYDTKDLPYEKVADFIEDNNLALNKTFPYFMAEDILANMVMVQEIDASYIDRSALASFELTYPPHNKYLFIKKGQLARLANETGVSIKPIGELLGIQVTRKFKKALESTTAAKKLKTSSKPWSFIHFNNVSQLSPKFQDITTKIQFPAGSLNQMQISKRNGMAKVALFENIPTQSLFNASDAEQENQLENCSHLAGVLLKSPKHWHFSTESYALKQTSDNFISDKILRVSRKIFKSTTDKDKKLPKTQNSTNIFKFPTLSEKSVQILHEKRREQNETFDSITTSKSSHATFHKKRVKFSLDQIPFYISTSKKPFNIFNIYRSFEVEYSQETTTVNFEVDMPVFNLTHYKSLQTSGERYEYHKQFVIEYLKVNDELIQFYDKYSKNKTSRIDYYNHLNQLKRIDFDVIRNFLVNSTSAQLFHEMWLFQQRKKHNATTINSLL